MGPRAYPPLKPREVVKILRTRGFVLDRTDGDHRQYVCVRGGRKYVVTVDMGQKDFDPFLIKSMIRQSGLSKDDFYCTIGKTAKKIGKSEIEKAELDAWLATLE